MNNQTAQGVALIAKDPVCGMKVNKEKATLTSVYEGNTYYFCRSGCKEYFDKDPDKLLEEGPLGMFGMMRELILGIFKKNK